MNFNHWIETHYLTSWPYSYTWKKRRLFNIFSSEIIIVYHDCPIYWVWGTTKDRIKRFIKHLRRPKPKEFTTNIYSGAIHMLHDPAYVWNNGKKKGLTSKRDAIEHAERNNLVFGGDDVEQEARNNKARIEKEEVDKTTSKIMADFEKLQYFKSKAKK